MESNIKIALIICATILILGGLGLYTFNNLVPHARDDVINVPGNSVVKTNPDLVKVYFNMETTGDTSSEATNKNSEAIEDMTSKLLDLGLKKEEIQTQGFNVFQWKEWENNKLVDKGYKATHQIIIELDVDRFSMIGKIIDAGANAEAMISYINFELSNEKQNEYKALAYKQASEDSRIKAESIAEGLGKKVGDVVSVSVNEWNYNPWPIYSNRGGVLKTEASDAKVATTSIQPSEQEISGSVSVTYKLR